MGLGPPVCGQCLVLLKLDTDLEGTHWWCPVCKGNKNLKMFGLWEFDNAHQDFVCRRTTLFENREVVPKNLFVSVTCRRKFPQGDPNELIRPWLEKHVGIQGLDWNWDMDPNNFENIEYYFRDKTHATLFELSW